MRLNEPDAGFALEELAPQIRSDKPDPARRKRNSVPGIYVATCIEEGFKELMQQRRREYVLELVGALNYWNVLNQIHRHHQAHPILHGQTIFPEYLSGTPEYQLFQSAFLQTTHASFRIGSARDSAAGRHILKITLNLWQENEGALILLHATERYIYL